MSGHEFCQLIANILGDFIPFHIGQLTDHFISKYYFLSSLECYYHPPEKTQKQGDVMDVIFLSIAPCNCQIFISWFLSCLC
jgi:hypothetical protein